MNRLTEAFERAADVLNENWAEQNEFGDVISLKYWPPGGLALPAIEWQAVVGEERVELIQDGVEYSEGVRLFREFDVRTPAVIARGITAFHADGVFEWNGETWALDEANSFWNDEFVTFGLMRERLLHTNECRRADV